MTWTRSRPQPNRCRFSAGPTTSPSRSPRRGLALKAWSRFLLLGGPVHHPACGSVARIDLGTRQVALDLDLIRAQGLGDCLEAILAHEVGHHVRYPGTLAVHARMRLLERGLLPLKDYSVTNLFTDLMINDVLRPPYEEQLARVYRSFVGKSDWQIDPAFTFYLAVYEERWRQPPGSMMGEASEEEFAKAYPGYRAEAQVLGEELFRLGPNVYTQFLYFVSVVSRYALPEEDREPVNNDPYSCGCGEPSPDDWADALTPDGREREAIRRARAAGWISEETAERMTNRETTDRRIAMLPGGADDADATSVPAVMAAYYRQQAERVPVAPAAATPVRGGDDTDNARRVGTRRPGTGHRLGCDTHAARTSPGSR